MRSQFNTQYLEIIKYVAHIQDWVFNSRHLTGNIYRLIDKLLFSNTVARSVQPRNFIKKNPIPMRRSLIC